MLSAHVQATWNRTAKEMGKNGRWGLVMGLALLVIFAGLPILAIAAMGGYTLGANVNHWSSPFILGGTFGIGAIFVGTVGGILGGTKALTWESYRVYPLKLRQLFAAEMVAGIADLLPAMAGFGALCFALGLGFARPTLLPFALVFWVQAMLWMLLTQHLVASLAAALMKRMKTALLLFGLVFWILSVSVSMLPKQLGAKQGERLSAAITPERLASIKQLGNTFLAFIGAWPSTHAARGIRDAAMGHWGSGLAHQIIPLLLLALALVLVARIMEREADPHTFEIHSSNKGAEKLWTFQSPAAGIARLHWKTLMGSQFGRFGLVMPIMTVVLIKGPFARMHGQTLWALPSAFAYMALTANQMQFNQFGLDGHGVKSLMLLPIRSRDILLGKLGGLAVFQGLQTALLLLLMGWLLRPSFLEMGAGICLAGCFFFVQMGLGHWTSCWMPRPMPRNSLKSGSMPLPIVLISLGTGILNSIFFGGIFVLCVWKAPSLLLPLMAALFGICALIYRQMLPTFAIYLDQRREKLVEAMG